jgi:hypothetical protein
MVGTLLSKQEICIVVDEKLKLRFLIEKKQKDAQIYYVYWH